MESILRNRGLATTLAFMITGILVLLEYFGGGVVTHHLLANEDMPGLSNWWGLVLVPVTTWIASTLINRRLMKDNLSDSKADNNGHSISKRFISALLFGFVMSVLWELGFEEVLQYIVLLPFFLALAIKVYFPECFIGFILGLLYTFGGILPILFGSIITIVCFIIHQSVTSIRGLVS